MKEQTGKRLFAYAMLYKRIIILALLLLIVAASAELAGPFLAKRIIDEHIMAIEKRWVQVEAQTVGEGEAVSYEGRWYMREDRLLGGVPEDAEVARVLQVGRSFYWLQGDLIGDGAGTRAVQQGGLTITNKASGTVDRYQVEQLGTAELYRFYRPELTGMLQLGLLYFALIAVASLFTYGQRLMLQTSANRIVQKMRNDVFAHLQRLPVRYFDNLSAGQVVSRVTNDTEAVRELFVAVLANFFTAAVYMTTIFGFLFILNVKLALIALPLVPMLWVWIVVYRKFAARYNKMIRSKLSEINGMVNESIQGMPIIQAFRREKQTMQEFEQLNEQYYTYQSKLLNLNSITSHNLVNVVRNVLFLIVVWFFWGDALGVLVTVGVLYAFIDYMNRMFQPIVGVVNQLSNLETARVSAGRVFMLMDEPGVPVEAEGLQRYKGDVAFERVSFAYKEGEYVLKDISFHVQQGQTLALVGHTGSGKSSILNLLFRFYDIQEGRITIDGMDIQELSKQQLRQYMGIVLQDPFLFTGTIASNISLNNPAISREKVVQALKDVGAYEMFSALPGGIDAPVIEKGSTLSAGQRQLISFARALAFDPAILILDEATASIDSETEAIIQRALDVLKQGRTTFVIAHRLSTIRQADQILVLDHGRIMEQGNHEQLMQQQGRYYAMYQLQHGPAVNSA